MLQIPTLTKEFSRQHETFYKKLCLDPSLKNTQCTNDTAPVLDWDTDFKNPWRRFADIIMVVTYNNPLYGNIGAIELLYRPFFANIIYCGPEELESRDNLYNVTFIKYEQYPPPMPPGSSMYKCSALAMDKYRSYNGVIKGYLLTADDALSMIPNLAYLPKHQIWYFDKSRLNYYDVSTKKNSTPWHWWKRQHNNMKSLITALQSQPHLQDCRKKLEKFTGAPNRVLGRVYADFFYVPSHMSERFMEIVNITIEHMVYLEIAVPTILLCMHNDTKPWTTATNDREFPRVSPWFQFTSPEGKWNTTYLHPMKWSCLNESESCRDLYCNTILPLFHNKGIENNPNCNLSKVKQKN